MAELLPDVEVYYKAVHDALAYQEFFDPKELDFADAALGDGPASGPTSSPPGKSPWTTATGLVVRGYVSKIDGSVQPYGLVVPESYTNKGPGRFRCDLWFHGRGETLSELNFIRDRTNNVGQFTPEDTIVLHPYGRYCNANKFAGEIDVLEALDSVKQRYRIDDDRIAVRGFSMGGAAAWQFAVHYPDRWFAANPGAGFSETPEFLKVFQQEKLQAHLVGEAALALVRLPRLVHQPAALPDGRLQRRDRPPEAGRRHDGKGPGRGRHRADAHHRPARRRHAIHPQSKVEIEERLQSLATQRPRLAAAAIWTSRPTRSATTACTG